MFLRFVNNYRNKRQHKTVYNNLSARFVIQEDNNYTLTITYMIIHLQTRQTINRLMIPYNTNEISLV